MADDAKDDAPVPVFKKPARRGNARKRERADDDDADAAGGAAAADGAASSSSVSLEMMRELQRQRQRSKGVTLEATGVGDAVDEALAAGGADMTEHGLESTFTSQTDSGEVDPNMLRYIEEQMHGGGDGSGGGGGGPSAAPILDPEEAALYETPAHLQGFNPRPEHNAVEDSANRWLAGITEVSLGTEAKMAVIEETERAKRAMMEKIAGRDARRGLEDQREHRMEMPANFNSNFHGHRRDNAVARKAAAEARGAQNHGKHPERSEKGLPSDGSAFGKFKSQIRNQKR